MMRFFNGCKTEECGGVKGTLPLGCRPLGETAVPEGKSRLEKNSSSSI